MLKARGSAKKINEARQAQEEDVNDSNPVEDDGPQVAGEATSAMHNVLDLQQNESEGPSLEELVSSFNADQLRVYECIKAHLEHQVLHERDLCQCKEFKPCLSVVWEVLASIFSSRAFVHYVQNVDLWYNGLHNVNSHCTDRTGSIQRGWSHHPLAASTAPRARRQNSRLLEAGQRGTESDACISLAAPSLDNIQSLNGVQS